MIKRILLILNLILTASILSAAIPLHNIVHEHYFIKSDPCGEQSCAKHIKKFSERCCKTSDAIFIADLQDNTINFKVYPLLSVVKTFYGFDNDFKLHFLVNNKAPPVSSI